MARSAKRDVAGPPGLMPRWPIVCAAAAVVVVAAAAVSELGHGGLVFAALLAIPVALAGIGAPSLRLPLGYGALMLAAALILAVFARGSLLWIVAPAAVAAAAVLSALGVVLT